MAKLLEKFTEESKIEYYKIMYLLIKVLDSFTGRSGTLTEIISKFRDLESISNKEMDIPFSKNNPRSKILCATSFALSSLKRINITDNSQAQGLWTLIKDNAKDLELSEIEKLYRESEKNRRKQVEVTKKNSEEISNDQNMFQGWEEGEEWKKELRNILQNLHYAKFEDFCKILLEKYGYLNVETTKTSSDGGIDLNAEEHSGIHTKKVIVQCKRYSNKNTVGARTVRELNGSMDAKNADYSLLITTSSFTKAAKEEVNQFSKKIELIDFDRLCSIIEEKELGVKNQLVLDNKFWSDIS